MMMRKERFMAENILSNPVGRRSCVRLPDRDARDPRTLWHRVHLPRSLVIKKLREIFRRGIDDVEGRLIVQELVIHALHDIADHVLQMREIIEQADGIEAGSLENDSHFVIVSVWILAFPFVTAQGVPRGKSLVNAYLKHRRSL